MKLYPSQQTYINQLRGALTFAHPSLCSSVTALLSQLLLRKLPVDSGWGSFRKNRFEKIDEHIQVIGTYTGRIIRGLISGSTILYT